MNGRTRASRVATAGSQNVVLAVDTEISAPDTLTFQAAILAKRYGLSPAIAALKAEHCFAVPETWRGAR
jgi:hypothetical protein